MLASRTHTALLPVALHLGIGLPGQACPGPHAALHGDHKAREGFSRLRVGQGPPSQAAGEFVGPQHGPLPVNFGNPGRTHEEATLLTNSGTQQPPWVTPYLQLGGLKGKKYRMDIADVGQW